MNRHLPHDLKQMQSVPLKGKIIMTQLRIQQWYDHWDGEVYVSFSGGKDSTVLLDICRKMYPDIEAVFVDTGLEYPEIRQFVKKFENVTWIRPEMSFKQVCYKYGFPFISKEVSGKIREVRRSRELGNRKTRAEKCFQANNEVSERNGGRYSLVKWANLLDAEFNISDKCCEVMKKRPIKIFEKLGKKPILALMTSESLKRKTAWMKTGCNAFDIKRPQSQPMAFWTEQDVLQYIKKYNLEIASVYGDIVVDEQDVAEGQITVFDILGDYEGVKLKTTGCKRTGCMFCGFGCQVKGDTRFLDMKRTHPRQYTFIFKPEEEGGLGYAEKIDYINETCKTNIKY